MSAVCRVESPILEDGPGTAQRSDASDPASST